MFTIMRAGAATVLLLVAGYANAQTTDAVCSADFAWANNDIGHNPCLVAAYLMAPCNPNGLNNVPKLGQAGQSYVQPGNGLQANACTCSSVTYSAIEACSLCQNGVSLKWSAWTAACDASMVQISGYPSSIETTERSHIPTWMLGDVLTKDGFDVAAAKELVESQTSIVPPQPSGTPAFIPGLGNSSQPQNKGISLGVIVAACIGSMAFVLIMAVLITWCVRLRRKRTSEMRQRNASAQWAVSIGKPVAQNPPTPGTGSSFGHHGPAPTPASGARSGWPADIEKGSPGSVPPLPPPKEPRSNARMPEFTSNPALRPVIDSSQEASGSPAPRSTRSATAGSDSAYSGSPASVRVATAKLAIAGPPPSAPYDPADPRTWNPAPPPPAKLQRGLSRSYNSLEKLSPVAPSSSRMFPSAAIGPSSPSTIALTLSPTSSSGRRPSDTTTLYASSPPPAPPPSTPARKTFETIQRPIGPRSLDSVDVPARTGLPATPRQQRAQRVKSRSRRPADEESREGEARYPTPSVSPAPRPLPSKPQPTNEGPSVSIRSASPSPRASPAPAPPVRTASPLTMSPDSRGPGLPSSPSPVLAPRTPLQQVPRSPLPPKSPNAESAYDGIVPEDEEAIRMPAHPFAMPAPSSSSSSLSLPRIGHTRQPSPPEIVVPGSRLAARPLGHSPQSSISSAAPPLSANSTAPLIPRRRYEAQSPSPSQIISPTSSTSSRRFMPGANDSRYPVFSPSAAFSPSGHSASASLDRGVQRGSPLAALGHAYSASADSNSPRTELRPLKPVTPLIQARFAAGPNSPDSPRSASTTATTFAARYATFGNDPEPVPAMPPLRRYESPSETMKRERANVDVSGWGYPNANANQIPETLAHRLTIKERPEGPQRVRRS